jgi:hypothetical protein
MSSTDTEWILARIEKTKCLIEQYEDALTALNSGVMTYSLDTGQSRQTVTKQDIAALVKALGSLENRLATLQARLYGGSVHVIPGW